MSDHHRHLNFRTETQAIIRGIASAVTCEESLLVIKVYTNDKHQGRSYPNEHIVKIPAVSKLYKIAALTQEGDLIEIRGPIHQDKSVVPTKFENFSLYYDGRNQNNGPLEG